MGGRAVGSALTALAVLRHAALAPISYLHRSSGRRVCAPPTLVPPSPTPAPPPTHLPACRVLPLMIGWFALNVPSGLSLYYFSNTVFTTASQVYLKKLGGGWVGSCSVLLAGCCAVGVYIVGSI